MDSRLQWRCRMTLVLALCGASSLGCSQPRNEPAAQPAAPAESKRGPGSSGAAGQSPAKARFSTTRPFSQGVAAVETADGWGYIDKSGAMVIAPQYRAVGDFAGPLAPARASYAIQRKGEGTYGYIDKRGRWVVPPVFHAVGPTIVSAKAPGVAGKKVRRTATFRGTQYSVGDDGVLRLAGRVVAPDAVATAAFIKETASDSVLTRMGAYRGLGRLATIRAWAALANVVARRGWQEATAAAQGLEEARRGAGVEYLIASMADEDEKVRRQAVYALLVLCRDPHCARELKPRMKLVPEKGRDLLKLRVSFPKPDKELSPVDKEVRNRLRQRLPRFELANVPLVLVVEFLRECRGGGLRVDWASLETLGMRKDMLIPVDVSDVQFEAAIREIFLNVPGSAPLDHGGNGVPTSISTVDELVARTRAAVSDENPLVRQLKRIARDAKAYPAVAKGLARKLPKIDFANVPLELVVQFMREVGGIPIYVDWPGLAKAGIGKDAEVNCHLVDVMFGKALWTMIRSAGGKADVGYCIAGGGLIVSIEQNLSARWKARFPGVLGRGRPDDALTRKLHQKVPPAKADEMSLAEAVEHVCKKAQVAIVVDWDGLKAVGIPKDMKVDVSWLTAWTVASALENLFLGIAWPGTVDFAEKDGKVIVTAARKSKATDEAKRGDRD